MGCVCACMGAHAKKNGDFRLFRLRIHGKIVILLALRAKNFPRANRKGTNKMAKKELVPTTKSGLMVALAAAGEGKKAQAFAIYDKLVGLA